jgi:hypothetical protein
MTFQLGPAYPLGPAHSLGPACPDLTV